MKRSTRRLVVGWVAVVLAVSAWPARATDLKIWMDEFKPYVLPVNGQSATATSYQSPISIQVVEWPSDSDSTYVWAPVNLPVGTVIKSVVYYHGGSIRGNYTYCDLLSVKFGKDGTVYSRGQSKAVSETAVPLVPYDAGTSLVIREGFRYMVRVQVLEGTTVRGVKITY